MYCPFRDIQTWWQAIYIHKQASHTQTATHLLEVAITCSDKRDGVFVDSGDCDGGEQGVLEGPEGGLDDGADADHHGEALQEGVAQVFIVILYVVDHQATLKHNTQTSTHCFMLYSTTLDGNVTLHCLRKVRE